MDVPKSFCPTPMPSWELPVTELPENSLSALWLVLSALQLIVMEVRALTRECPRKIAMVVPLAAKQQLLWLVPFRRRKLSVSLPV